MHISDVLVESLGYGEENAVTAEHLQAITGLDGRTLRFCVQELRRMGLCVLSSIDGYFRPSRDAAQAYSECRRFNRMMKARAISSFQTARITEIYMRSIDGQQTIDDFDAQTLTGNEEF